MHPNLTLDTKSPFQFVFTKIKNKAAQDTLVGLASSVETGGAPNPGLSTGFVYMAVDTDQWLKLLDGTTHTCASHRDT